MRSFDADWANFEWDQDDHMEELWEKGEAGEDFDSSSRIIEPDHFQCLFLIMGCLFCLWLIVALFDILTNSVFGFLTLMLAGLLACLLVTLYNLFLFSTALWKPITLDNGKGDIFMEDYEFDREILVNNKTVAFTILGYGAVTSFFFIFIAVIKSLGKTYF